jgi:hypothetical protein
MHYAPLLGALLLAQPPVSGPVSASVTLNVILGSHARLSFTSTTLAFPDADPDLVPLVSGVPGDITLTAKARTTRNAQVTVTLQAADDLRSGISTLPPSLITWTSAGAGFVPGVLSRSAQLVGTWTGSGVRSGAQRFVFENRWTHPPGTYSVTFIYTLSTP